MPGFGSGFTGLPTASGVWLPVSTNWNNIISASPAGLNWNWIRVGNQVLFNGQFNITMGGAVAGTQSGFYFTLPVSRTNFSSLEELNCNGTAPFVNTNLSGQPKIADVQVWMLFLSPGAGLNFYARFVGGYILK